MLYPTLDMLMGSKWGWSVFSFNSFPITSLSLCLHALNHTPTALSISCMLFHYHCL
ncbi:hypothetical protein BDP27DRAFT_232080 [Rhodocollybia butyracea]|uniref:Uncharacterized protein n=1 Tax=Rhodocollybia butyracea TaxID=206335 RepID=A0A9P5U2N1_9AGAR|nr:hypothetical protein BDP27DRAFT_433620 [Rhodocollybia butyracea]KAF9063634.1 hypothetical protein BDP27DRAFT_232080 [Rhodocollybia butyracea]